MVHYLKISKIYVNNHLKGLKPWELRKNDRNFKEGDFIRFSITDLLGIELGVFFNRKITSVFFGGKYGLEKDYCILTLEKI